HSRAVRLGPKFLVQRFHQRLRSPGRVNNLLDRDSIHPRCAVVTGYLVPGRLKHVPPKDPVIHRVKPELRLSLRLQVKRLSQREELQRQPIPIDREGLRQRSLIVRSGGVPQAALLVSDSALCWQGPFAPQALPCFLATTTPSDSQPCRTRELWIPRRPPGRDPRMLGLPGSSISLSARTVLSHPGEPERMHMPVASSSVLASPSLAGWPLSSFVFRGRIRFACATA